MISSTVKYNLGHLRKKACLQEFANNKGANQPVHQRSLISAFVVHLLERTISIFA